MFRPTHFARLASSIDLVAGPTAMKSGWGDDVTAQRIAHWLCEDPNKTFSVRSNTTGCAKGVKFFDCGCA